MLVTDALLSSVALDTLLNTVYGIVTVVVAPTAIGPAMLHVSTDPLPTVQEPATPVTVALPCCSPDAGHVSVSTTFVAELGPLLVTTSVYVPVAPGATVDTPSCLVTLRSAVGVPAATTVKGAEPALLAVFVSVWLPDAVAVAVVELVPTVSCVPVTTNDVLAPGASGPMPEQVTVNPATVHTVVPDTPDTLTAVTPVGSVTVSVTPVAVAGPALVTVTVCTRLPAAGSTGLL